MGCGGQDGKEEEEELGRRGEGFATGIRKGKGVFTEKETLNFKKGRIQGPKLFVL